MIHWVILMRWCTAALSRTVFEQIGVSSLNSLTSLSPREADVLRLVVSVATNKAIAIRLDISIKTVEKHRGKLMKKRQVANVPDLMRVWLQAHPDELNVELF